MALAQGASFAGYRILRLLGSGGMGEVYLAQHPRLPRQYALKVLPAELSADIEYRNRFAREADLAAALYHPHIVGVHDRGESDGQLWIAMDYVDGPDCDRLMQQRYPAGMPLQEALDIVAAVADALDYAHGRGLLHRDVKPANILLTRPEVGGRRILLADFGIARHVGDAGALTATNMVMGTAAYAAPEQLMGHPLDGRADQYALAASAYQLLTGSRLFPYTNPAVVISHHLNSAPPTLVAHNATLAALDPVLAVGLAKDPADRFARCVDFAGALAAASGTAAAAAYTQAAPVQRPRNPPRPRSATRALPQNEPSPAPHQQLLGAVPQRIWNIGAAIIVITIFIVVGVIVGHRSPRDEATPTTITATTTTTTAPQITFETMRDFVIGYYQDLPANPQRAWSKLAAGYQAQTGFADYRSFWATIASVTVVSVIPRDATSVTARLTYARTDGQTDTENRWLRMALVNGVMLLDGSERN